ncbi:MAG: hypothetical protein A2V77_10120 [Anaeromyxobacter sp. RBG_16_69_14]|nr:MAG: hypothetical protein A2V77_10120 [Anaeromyxobacter sp. RBG_16_69_14]
MRSALRRVDDENAAREFAQKIIDKRDSWIADVLTGEDRDNIACFSAYMLGACGPDFWTLPSVPEGLLPVPDVATAHFDLGHYNRTHRQFEVSVQRVGKKDDLKSRLEQAYFHGMATHFAADLVVHQLVNVSAGAYNLLQKNWHHEQARNQGLIDRTAADVVALWSTHNKVEHYWDSYVRYCWLGDYGPLWESDGTCTPENAGGWAKLEPLGLPTIDTLKREVAAIKKEAVRAKLEEVLARNDVKWALERPLNFPWVFCDRVLIKDQQNPSHLEPFIHNVVVDEKEGAYPSNDVCKSVREEKSSFQMDDPYMPHGKSERRKLLFFSSHANGAPGLLTTHTAYVLGTTTEKRDLPDFVGDERTTWNYLTYTVCPDLDKVKKYGRDVFYHLDALGAFVHSAADLAKVFMGGLASAYKVANPTVLGPLSRFWNLDTGLGLAIQKVASDTSKEAITRLDFVHAFTLVNKPAYDREAPYLESMQPMTYAIEDTRAFPIRKAAGEFENFRSISEPDEEAFLDRIRLTDEARGRGRWPAHVAFDRKTFFDGRATPAEADWIPVTTTSLKKPNKIVILDVKHRLTLDLRVPVADLGEVGGAPVCAPDGEVGVCAPEKLCLFFAGDGANGLRNACTKEAKEWLERSAKPLDHSEEPDETKHGLQYFSTRLFVNFETEKNLARKVQQGVWNNVVPFRAHEAHYGRNFAVGTGRCKVLHPTVQATESIIMTGKKRGFQFDPETQFAYYDNLSPTEQVFFTLYPLVKEPDGHVYDMLSKERVNDKQFDDLKRIDAVGFVKIVLLYQLAPRGALQLDRCYVDGLEVPVESVREKR